VGTLKISNSS